MSQGLPGFEIPTPKFVSDLVALPYHKGVMLDPQSNTRWKLRDNELIRDHRGSTRHRYADSPREKTA